MNVEPWVDLTSESGRFCSSTLVDRFTWREGSDDELEINTPGGLIVDFAEGADVEHDGRRVVYEEVPRVVYLSLRDVAADEEPETFDMLFGDEVYGHEAWTYSPHPDER